MKSPRAKIMQITASSPGVLICLCDDGSLWQFHIAFGTWKQLHPVA